MPLVLGPLAAVCLLAGPARAQEPVKPAVEELDRTQLESLVRELERRVGHLEQTAVTPDADPRASFKDATHTTPDGFLRIPGTDAALHVGGYVKLDVIHDFNAIDNKQKFATQSISVPDESLSRTTFNVQESRINLDLRQPVGDHEGRVFVEGDFYGSGGTFKLRHAYGELGGLLAGQTWTTYMDLSSRPHTLDFEGPDGEMFVRQPMLRWTHPLSDATTLQVALEGSAQDIDVTGGFAGDDLTPLPDLTGNVRLEGQGRHLQVSGVLRYLDFEGDPGSPDDSTLGWGLALSGKTDVAGAGRRLMGQVAYGEGSAYYNQALRGAGSDAVLEPGGDLEALPVVSAVLGFEHDWSKAWSSTLALSMASVDNASAQAAEAINKTRSASANLVWHPYKQFLTGAEYLYGTRENNDGQDGHAHRLQFSVKFLF